MRRIIIVTLMLFAMPFVALVFSGCATTESVIASKILEADERTVVSCKYLGDVTGTSGWGNLAASTGIKNAKNEAIEQAASLGATHVVWNQVSGGYSPFVNGRAYRCE